MLYILKKHVHLKSKVCLNNSHSALGEIRFFFCLFALRTYNMRVYRDGLSFPSFTRFVKVARSYISKDSHLSELIKHLIIFR